MWSDDGGRSWTEPIKTQIWGHPAHLLKLADGRILCTHGYRRTPLGVRTVFSEDSGETWDVAGTVVLRGDSSGHSPHRGEGTGVGDVGYPVSMQLPGGADPDRLLRHPRRQRDPLRRHPLAVRPIVTGCRIREVER